LDIRMTCRHCELSDDLRDYVTKKMERVLRHFDAVHSVDVILSAEGAKWTAELIVGAVRGQRCVAEGVGDDAFAAIDVAVDKMDRQVMKLKGKLREHYGKGPEGPGRTGE
jgi:putative sigma-54 modulation protein